MRKDMARTSLYSLLALLFPMLLGLIFIPVFIHDFGKERFSFLSLVWAILGYFTFLDLGIGRTLTKFIAQQNTLEQDKQTFSFITSAHLIVFTISVAFSTCVFLLAEKIVLNFLKVSPELHIEFMDSIQIVAIGIPFVTLTSVNRSILDGLAEFSLSNILQVLIGVFLFILPNIFWKFSPSMVSICVGIVFGRILVYAFSHYLYKRKLSVSQWHLALVPGHFKMLLSHGIWITLSNLLSPVLSVFDKVFLGNISALKNIAFYTTPMEMITRLWAIPNSVTRVFFPQFAIVQTDEQIQTQFRSAAQIMGAFVFPVCLLVFVFAFELLSIWINREFAIESFLLAQIMIIGLVFNCFNWIPFGWLQATRHVQWSVYTILIEIPVFFFCFYYFTERYGLIGSAAVWTGRMIFDYLITFVVVIVFRPGLLKEFTYSLAYVSISSALFVALSLVPSLPFKISLALLCLLAFAGLNFRLFKEMLLK